MGNAIADKIAEYGIRIEQALNRISGYVDPEEGVSATGLAEKDVNFYDYDGTLLHSYTKDEFLELEALPAGPDHSDRGWEFLGWSTGETIEDAKDMVNFTGSCEICAVYRSLNTTIKLNFDNTMNRTITLVFNQETANGVEIDWGDGSEIVTYSLADAKSHTYASPGEFTITITPLTNGEPNDEYCQIAIGSSDSDINFFNGQEYPASGNAVLAVTDIALGSNVSAIYSLGLCNLPRLKTIMISYGIPTIGDGAFHDCVSLKAFMVPPSVRNYGTHVTLNCYSLRHMVLPEIEYLNK